MRFECGGSKVGGGSKRPKTAKIQSEIYKKLLKKVQKQKIFSKKQKKIPKNDTIFVIKKVDKRKQLQHTVFLFMYISNDTVFY